MIPTPTQLLTELETGEIPLANIFTGADCDSLLEQRDSNPAFAQLYRVNWEQLEKLKFIFNCDPTEAIGKRSFLAVSNATEQHEIASYVANDLKLIAWQSHSIVKHELPELEPSMINWLYSQYKSGKFPTPPYPGP